MAIAIYQNVSTGRHHYADPTSLTTLDKLESGEWVLFDATPDDPPPAPDPFDAAMAARVPGSGLAAVALRAASVAAVEAAATVAPTGAWDFDVAPTVNGAPVGATPPDASTTAKGIVELATNTETTTGTDSGRAVTPAGLKVVADAKVDTSAVGAANGVASLGSDSKLPASQLPDLAITQFLGTTASQAAMLALTGQRGDWTIRSDTGTVFVLNADTPATLGSWTQLSYPAAPVSSVAGKTGVVALVKADVGLGSVDNTSDASKPVSTAQQTALDAKANRLLTINAQAGAYTLALTDANDVAVHMTSGSAVALTYPPNSTVPIPIGASGMWFAAGAGQITHTPGAGVTLQATGGALKSAGQLSEGTWRKVATNTFVISGPLTT